MLLSLKHTVVFIRLSDMNATTQAIHIHVTALVKQSEQTGMTLCVYSLIGYHQQQY